MIEQVERLWRQLSEQLLIGDELETIKNYILACQDCIAQYGYHVFKTSNELVGIGKKGILVMNHNGEVVLDLGITEFELECSAS